MTNRSRFPLSAALALSIAAAAAPGAALAQDGAGTPPAADPATTTTPGATPGSEGMAGTPAATAAKSGGGLTNNTGQVFVNINAAVDLSKDVAAKRFNIAPALYYGVNDDLTVGFFTGQIAGYPPAAGGLCLGGEENGCTKVYNNLNLDVLYSFLRQEGMQVAAHGGVDFPAFSPEVLVAVRVGVAAMFKAAGILGILVDPSLRIGATKRDLGNKEFLSVPVRIGVDATPELNLHLFSGIFGFIDGFGDNYVVPLGVGGMFALNEKMGVGAQFLFLNLGGKQIDMGPGRADLRSLILTFNFRT